MNNNKMNNDNMWTLWELPRILELYEDEYIIYDVSKWSDNDASRVHNTLLFYAEHDGTTVEKIAQNDKIIIVRYVKPAAKHIHLLTNDMGTKITIPEGKTIENFIEMYLTDDS